MKYLLFALLLTTALTTGSAYFTPASAQGYYRQEQCWYCYPGPNFTRGPRWGSGRHYGYEGPSGHYYPPRDTNGWQFRQRRWRGY
jgi:hypothetical protein